MSTMTWAQRTRPSKKSQLWKFQKQTFLRKDDNRQSLEVKRVTRDWLTHLELATMKRRHGEEQTASERRKTLCRGTQREEAEEGKAVRENWGGLACRVLWNEDSSPGYGMSTSPNYNLQRPTVSSYCLLCLLLLIWSLLYSSLVFSMFESLSVASTLLPSLDSIRQSDLLYTSILF